MIAHSKVPSGREARTTGTNAAPCEKPTIPTKDASMVLLIRLSDSDAQFGSVVGCPCRWAGRASRGLRPGRRCTRTRSHAAGEPQSASRTPSSRHCPSLRYRLPRAGTGCASSHRRRSRLASSRPASSAASSRPASSAACLGRLVGGSVGGSVSAGFVSAGFGGGRRQLGVLALALPLLVDLPLALVVSPARVFLQLLHLTGFTSQPCASSTGSLRVRRVVGESERREAV